MSDSSRTLEQRVEAALNSWIRGPGDFTAPTRMRAALDAAGLPDLLAERDALLERAEKVKKDAEVWQRIQEATEADRDAAQAAAQKAALDVDELMRRVIKADADLAVAQAAAREMARVLEQVAAGEVGGRMRARLVLADFPGFLEEGS